MRACVRADTHTHTSAVKAEGKIQLFACLGSSAFGVAAFAPQREKVASLF